MKKNIEWFIERIGKKIIATSPKAFNGEMTITDAEHAKHLCLVCQEFQQYEFKDLEGESIPPEENFIDNNQK